MKIKLKTILDSQSVLLKVLQSNLSAVISFKLSKLFKSVDAEIKSFVVERDKLLVKYGKKQEDNTYKIDEGDSNYEIFIKEIDDLVNLEIELFDYEPINISMINEIKLSPIEMTTLIDFFTDK